MKISCIPRLFSISHSNYNKNKRSSQCDCWRKSKHSKCRYTCEKRRGLTGIYLQSSKQILCGPTPEKQSAPADCRNALFSFLGKSQALMIDCYFSRFYFNNCYVFVQQCGQFISKKSFNVTPSRISPRIGAEEYDKLIAGI